MEKHYDVGIVGVWYGQNYGSLLNGFSLNRLITDLGYSVLMLNKPGAEEGKDAEITNTYNADFADEYYNTEYMTFNNLEKINDLCNTFCVGSDQIWNKNLINFSRGTFTLNFVKKDKRKISFGTSFGHSNGNLIKLDAADIGNISQFNAISIREKFGVDICREKFGLQADLVIDPVFCIDKSLYFELAKKSNIDVSEPYILTYILDPTPEKRNAIIEYEKLSGLKAINILDGMRHLWNKNNDLLNLPNTPLDVNAYDFLKLFANANFILTDSFHGTAFAAIFNKPFLSIGNHSRGFDRFTDILGRIELTNNFVFDQAKIPIDKKYLENYNFNRANALMRIERKKSIDWLKSALEKPVAELIKTDEEKIKKILGVAEIEKKTADLPVNQICKANLCTGCGACANICPAGAFEIKPDVFGFYSAVFDEKKCVSCGKCNKICPVLHKKKIINSTVSEVEYFVADDEKILVNCSSGGAFPLLAEYFYSIGGVVAGVTLNEDLYAEHILTESQDEFYKIAKSKYMQSKVGNIYKQVGEKLKEGKYVLFSGCPCQVAGLYNYLGEDNEKLFTVDLLCSHSPSPGIFHKYLKEVHGDVENIKSFEFRIKKDEQGKWFYSPKIVKIIFKDNSEKFLSIQGKDLFERLHHSKMSIPVHCEKCAFKTLPRMGDITLGDFWGISKAQPSTVPTNGKGVSVVIQNNAKGQILYNKIKNKSKLARTFSIKDVGGNGRMFEPADKGCPNRAKRDLFYKLINKTSLKDTVEQVENLK